MFLLVLGFVRFLGPYYMLVITKRRKIGAICGHTIYAITKSEMIPVPNPTARSKLAYSKDENRSFVHSACKCNMYLVPLKRHKRVAFRSIHCPCVFRYYVIVLLYMSVSINYFGQILWFGIVFSCIQVLHFGGNLCIIFFDPPSMWIIDLSFLDLNSFCSSIFSLSLLRWNI